MSFDLSAKKTTSEQRERLATMLLSAGAERRDVNPSVTVYNVELESGTVSVIISEPQEEYGSEGGIIIEGYGDSAEAAAMDMGEAMSREIPELVLVDNQSGKEMMFERHMREGQRKLR